MGRSTRWRTEHKSLLPRQHPPHPTHVFHTGIAQYSRHKHWLRGRGGEEEVTIDIYTPAREEEEGEADREDEWKRRGGVGR